MDNFTLTFAEAQKQMREGAVGMCESQTYALYTYSDGAWRSKPVKDDHWTGAAKDTEYLFRSDARSVRWRILPALGAHHG